MKKFLKILTIFVFSCMATYGFSNNTSVASDQEIMREVNNKIGPGWFSNGYDQVKVQVNNGVVTLSGYVKTHDEKEKVEREIRNIDGVTNVDSKLHVQDPNSRDSREARKYPQDSYSSSSDDQLNKKIRDNISNGWLWDSYEDLSLNTTDGVVTLEGTVEDAKDQQKIMTEIQKTPGVKSVKSNLRIQSQEERRQ